MTQQRKCTFHVYKDGERRRAEFLGSESFQRSEAHELLDAKRVFGVDTESLTKAGQLRTLLVPVHFHDGGEVIETPHGTGMLEKLFELVHARFAVPETFPSQTAQRRKRKRGWVRGRSRDGRRQTIEPVLSVWFNLSYDIGRLLADQRHTLRSVAAGADSYRVRVSPRWELEVARMHFGSSSSFEWYVRDLSNKTIVRMLGIDLTGYWKTSLANAAKSVGVTEKVDIEAQIENVYEKPFESFTDDEWRLFKSYGLGDVQTTLELYHATAALLTTIDARVVRRNGVIPPSAPGAACRIVFAKAFDEGCHPELDSWKRYPAWADQMGCDAYFGGRAFCVEPGIHENMVSLDIKSAYPFQMALMPDPVDVKMRYVDSQPFNVDDWRGCYGVLYVSGHATDDIYPALRMHDDEHDGRLRYIYGRFENIPATIPELVIGVLRGALRIDRIHKGVVMQGSADRSFLRAGVRAFFDIKEDPSNAEALRHMAKLFMNSPYGKLVETTRRDYLLAEVIPMPRFVKRARVAESIARVFTEVGESSDGLYWGETEEEQKASRGFFESWRSHYENIADIEQRATEAIDCYVTALRRAGVASDGETRVGNFMREFKRYKCGHYFMPLYAAQVTGATSAMVGLMAASIGAIQGDTDSVHVVVPEGVTLATELPGIDDYYSVMKRAGYKSPRRTKNGIVDGIEGMTTLGLWDPDKPSELDKPLVPSTETVLVRPKVYSHRFATPKEVMFKQAKHGFAKFDSPKASAARSDAKVSREERMRASNRANREALHENMRKLVAGEEVSYETRRSPRKLREAVLRGEPVGEFTSREVTLRREYDPNTRLDDEGVIRWLPLKPGVEREMHRERRTLQRVWSP